MRKLFFGGVGVAMYYTSLGMYFPRNADYILHLIGGFVLAWILERPTIYFSIAVLGEVFQPFFCSGRGFELHDVLMNSTGCLLYFFLNSKK